mmetsp:Transcript_18139/g.63726  ORF Transcript_18139/g.63726 Transcript_18139/m.63726 type:complete len:234 (-) Transcript_18139:959-1660(-)
MRRRGRAGGRVHEPLRLLGFSARRDRRVRALRGLSVRRRLRGPPPPLHAPAARRAAAHGARRGAPAHGGLPASAAAAAAGGGGAVARGATGGTLAGGAELGCFLRRLRRQRGLRRLHGVRRLRGLWKRRGGHVGGAGGGAGAAPARGRVEGFARRRPAREGLGRGGSGAEDASGGPGLAVPGGCSCGGHHVFGCHRSGRGPRGGGAFGGREGLETRAALPERDLEIRRHRGLA